jgi:mRNA interferase MazF
MGGRGRRSFLAVTRGEIYTAAARGPYTGKPRTVVILQDDRFDATTSVTVCPFTTNPVEAPLLRLPIDPSEDNGLEQPSQLMLDKVTTVPRSSLGERLGKLRDDEFVALGRSLIVFLGLASAPQT